MNKTIGLVTWFNKSKGYGEIFGEDGEAYFFTYEDIESSATKFKVANKDDYYEFTPGQLTRFGIRRADNMQKISVRTKKTTKKIKEYNV